MTRKDPPIECESSKCISICLMAKGRLLEQIMTFYVALKEYKKE